jgi:hypothetical protein
MPIHGKRNHTSTDHRKKKKKNHHTGNIMASGTHQHPVMRKHSLTMTTTASRRTGRKIRIHVATSGSTFVKRIAARTIAEEDA